MNNIYEYEYISKGNGPLHRYGYYFEIWRKQVKTVFIVNSQWD